MYNRILKLGALPLIVLFAAACSDNGMTGPESETQTVAFSVTDVPAGEMTSETLYAAQDDPVGTVTVTHEGGGQVSITYDVDSGVCLTETHWEATYGEASSLTNRGGNPTIGRFAYGDDELDCVSSFSEGPVDITGDDSSEEYIVAAHAVVELGGASVNPQVVHGTFDADGDGAEEGDIYGINPSTGDLTLVADVPNDDSGDPFDPNGLALDRATEELFFVESGDLYKVPAENADPTAVTPTLVRSSLGGEGPIRNATIGGDSYYYIPNGTEALWSVPTDGSADAANVCDLDTPATGGLFFGDIAASLDADGVFHGVARMNSGSDGEVIFFTVDTSDCTSTVVREADLNYDFQLQVAFGDDGTLYGQQAISEPEGVNPGQWYILDPETGLITSTLETTDRSFTDIAGGLPFEAEGEEETAWADGTRFTERGNWATWMGPFSIE